MCQRHWYGLPVSLRDAFWQARRAGVESDLQAVIHDCLASVVAELPAPVPGESA